MGDVEEIASDAIPWLRLFGTTVGAILASEATAVIVFVFELSVFDVEAWAARTFADTSTSLDNFGRLGSN